MIECTAVHYVDKYSISRVKTRLLYSLLFLVLAGSILAQSANDLCSNAIALPTDGTCSTFNNTNASYDLGNGICSNGKKNVWFSFVAQGPDFSIESSSLSPTFEPEITLIKMNPVLCNFSLSNQFACGSYSLSGTELEIGEIYSVIITSKNEEYNDFKVCINNPPPMPSVILFIDPISNICLDGSSTDIQMHVTIQGGDGSGIGAWSASCGNCIDPVSGLFDPQLADEGQNIISYTFIENGVNFVESINVQVNAAPEIIFGNSGLIDCGQPQHTLNSVINGSDLDITWTGPGIISDHTIPSPTVDLPGWYEVTVIDQITGCESEGSIFVDAGTDLPVANAGNDLTLTCAKPIQELEGFGSTGPNFQWNWDGPLHHSQANLQNPEISSPGIYILTIYDITNHCKSVPDTVIVFENVAEPEVEISNPIDPADCQLLGYLLDGTESPNSIYSWYDQNASQIGTTSDIQVEVNGWYFLEVQDTTNGCVGIDSIYVSGNSDYPIIRLATTDPLSCDKNEVPLNAIGSHDLRNITIKWEGPAGGLSGPDDELLTSARLPGEYTLILKDTINGCQSDTSQIVVLIEDGPLARITEPDELDCSTFEVEIDGSASQGSVPLTYHWSFNSTIVSEAPILSTSEPGNYQLIVVDSKECSDTISFEVVQNTDIIEEVFFNIQQPSCFNTNDATISINAIVGGTPEFTFNIDTFSFVDIDMIEGLTQGEYILAVEDERGCKWDSTFTIEGPPGFELSVGNDIFLNLGSEATINVEHSLEESEIQSLEWTPVNLISCIDSLSEFCYEVSIVPLTNMTITATLTDTNGCVVTDQMQLLIDKDKLLFIPNVFTPNEDGENDLLAIFTGENVRSIKHFYVYDRWGEIMYTGNSFQPNDPNYGWDGKLNGKPLDPGVFIYWAEVELLDGQSVIFKGDVTLIR